MAIFSPRAAISPMVATVTLERRRPSPDRAVASGSAVSDRVLMFPPPAALPSVLLPLYRPRKCAAKSVAADPLPTCSCRTLRVCGTRRTATEAADDGRAEVGYR